MINRRDLFKAVPAVALGAIVPSQVFADVPPQVSSVGETTMEVVRKYFADSLLAVVPHPDQWKENQIIINLNQLIVNKLPKIFNEKRQIPYGLTRGKRLYNKDYTHATIVDDVYSRAFKTDYSLNYAHDLKEIYGIEAEEKLMQIITDKIALEILQEEHKLNLKGQIIKPYIPVIMVRTIDPLTFMPMIGFKTHYAVGTL